MRFELSSRDGWHILRHMEKCLELWVRGSEEVGEGNGERWPSVICSPRGQITESHLGLDPWPGTSHKTQTLTVGMSGKQVSRAAFCLL